MNPFFVNSSIILDRADAMFRAHDRMFNMIHNRMREEAQQARRETDIYRAPLAPGQVIGRPSGRMRDGFYNNMPDNFSPRARSSGRPIQRSSFSEVPSPSNGIRRFNTLAREGIQPQVTNGDTSVSSAVPKRRSSAATSNSRRSVDHSTSSSSDKSPSTANNNNKAIGGFPFKYTRSHGLGWYQISDADSGNVTIRGNNLSCAANTAMNIMIVHYPAKALGIDAVAPYRAEMRCQAKWDQSFALLYIVLGFQNSESYHLLSIDENEHRTELRRCAGAAGTLRLSSGSTLLGNQSYSSSLTTHTKDEDNNIVDGSSSVIDGNSHRFMSILLKVDDGKVTLLINGEIAFSTAAALIPRSSVSGQANAIFGIFCTRSNRVQIKDWRVTVSPSAADVVTEQSQSISNGSSKAGGKTLASFYNAPSTTSGQSTAAQQPVRGAKAIQQASLPQLQPQPLQGEVTDRIKALPFEPELINGILADIVPAGSITINFQDIAALTGPKRILSEAVLLPLLMPELFVGLREPWRCVLLFGSPGTGKTMLAKAVAGQHRGTFFSCAASTLISKWRGDSEKLVKCLFAAARASSPSVVFLDEVDALVSSRGGSGEHESSRRMKTEFFSQMDGLTTSSSSAVGGQQVMVLATTNCPWDLDAAVLRRFEKRIYVPLPDREARYEHFRLCLRDLQRSDDTNKSDMESLAMELADRSEGYSSADIVQVCREAAMAPMRRLLAQHSMDDLQSMRDRGNLSAGVAQVQKEDYEAALRQTKPSVPAATIARYEQWNQMFGSGTDVV